MLLFSSSTLPRASRLKCHGRLEGTPPLVCVWDWQSAPIITGTSVGGLTDILTLCDPAGCLAPELIPVRLFTASSCPSSHTTTLSCCSLIDVVCIWGVCGCALWHHNGTSSSRPKYMEAFWTCRTSSHRMNSSLILAIHTQVSGHRPRDSFTKPSFKMGTLSPDAIWWMYSVFRPLLGSPVVMSGVAIITDVPVSIVTRHDLSAIHPSVFLLSWSCFSNMLNI
jgi:hypothetical protein